MENEQKYLLKSDCLKLILLFLSSSSSLLRAELLEVLLHGLKLTDEHFPWIPLILQILLVEKCLFEHFSHIFLLNQRS